MKTQNVSFFKLPVALLAMAIMYIVSCSKTDTDTGDNSNNNNPGKNTLIVDGVTWAVDTMFAETSLGYLNIGVINYSKGVCRAIFKTLSPATGTYSSNWQTPLNGNECKLMLQKNDPNGFAYFSPQGMKVTVTNLGNGKQHIAFAASAFEEFADTAMGPGRKTVSANFGND